jgi:hypothetical protein
MAIYPDDATISATAFATITGGQTTFSNTAARVDFNLPITVSYVAEVFVTIDGIVQDVSSYYLSNNNATVSFFNPPDADTMVVRCIDLPAKYRKIRSAPTLIVSHVKYSNTSFTTLGGNSYILNGVRTSFSLPQAVLGSAPKANAIFVILSGVMQNQEAYTYPSTTLGLNGIDFDTAPAVAGTSSNFANTTLEIRAFTTESTYTTRFTDMRDRKPNNGFMIQDQFNVSKYSSQAGYEKRRLMSRRPKRNFQLTYTNVTGIEKEAIQNFYRARNGEFETFTFDLTHINDTGTVRTRFNGPLEIQQVISSGTALTQNYYNVRLSFQEDFN